MNFGFNRVLVAASLAVVMIINAGCSDYGGGEMDLDVAYAGLFNTVSKFPASGGGSTDAIWLLNDEYCEVNSLTEAYRLKWNGSSFSTSYMDVCTTETGNVVTTIVAINGQVSSNYKTLISFTGSRTLRQMDPQGYGDEVEQAISLKDVPLDKDDDRISATIYGDVSAYIISAYWRHTVTTPSSVTVYETGSLNFSHPSTELNVFLTKEY